MSKKLSLSEAIKQGYKYCGYKKDDWQYLQPLDNLQNNDEGLIACKYTLCEKAGFSPAIDGETLADIIADHMYSAWIDETGDDDANDIYDTIREIDMNAFADMINEKLSHKEAYRFTEITLTPSL